MTDKQIIIDELKNEIACKENIINHLAEYNIKLENQLKAKEQECKKLKNERTVDFVKQPAQLKAENDGLKTMLKDLSYENQKFCYQIEEQTKQLEPFKDEYFKGLDNVAIAKLAKKSIRITAENSKLEQTLIEIKEIAEGMHDLWINKTPYTDMDNLVKHLLECELNRIRYKLDEISEAVSE